MLAAALTSLSLAAALAPAAPSSPAGEDEVCRATVPHGAATIELVEGKRIGTIRRESAPHDCGASLTVRAPGQRPVTKAYPDIEAAGGDFGVAILDDAIGRYRAISKRGDNDGRLLLVGPRGRVVDLPGPAFFVAAGRFLVVEQESDLPQLTVFDLDEGKIVLQAVEASEAVRLGLVSAAAPESWVLVGDELYWVAPRSPVGDTPAARLVLAPARLERADLAPERLALARPVAWVGKTPWQNCSCAVPPASGP